MKVARQKTGNELPKKGNGLHLRSRAERLPTYEAVIADALRKELVGSHKAKTLMHWTGAGERTAKSWLSGAAGPNGVHLVLLIGRSDAVLDAVLKLARPDRDKTERVRAARGLLEEAMLLLD